MVVALKADTGLKSMKATINPANVETPQGRQHLRIFVEWDDAKDVLANCKRAGFEPGDQIRRAMEIILDRRCIFVEI